MAPADRKQYRKLGNELGFRVSIRIFSVLLSRLLMNNAENYHREKTLARYHRVVRVAVLHSADTEVGMYL